MKHKYEVWITRPATENTPRGIDVEYFKTKTKLKARVEELRKTGASCVAVDCSESVGTAVMPEI